MGSAGGQKRIGKELADISSDPPNGITVRLPDESDLHIWEITLQGPPESVYKGGTFLLSLHLPDTYPFKPPVLSFSTKIYHPNVSNDEKGSMCLALTRPDTWKPPNKIRAVLESARQLLIEPNSDDAVEGAIAEQWRDRRAEWEKTAREWTRKYAVGK